jgi:hypothetical protein
MISFQLIVGEMTAKDLGTVQYIKKHQHAKVLLSFHNIMFFQKNNQGSHCGMCANV